MIVFLGDSFTWGQGLQFIHLVEKKGWSWEDCNKILPPTLNLESLGFDEDEYRKQNSFPHLTSKKVDLPYCVGRFENGGDNQTIYQMLTNMNPFISLNNIFCIIIQFSEPSRSMAHEYTDSLGDVATQIKYQVTRIDEFCKFNKISWFGLSWEKEIGDILKESYPQNYIPIIYNDIEYTNFGHKHQELNQLFLNKKYPTSDTHLNLEGHHLVSEMIYQTIIGNPVLQQKLIYYKEKINSIRYQ